MRTPFKWNLCRTAVYLCERTAIMGILNVTPDSFSDGGQYFEGEKAIARGKEIEQQGADIIDIGGESSRPGSQSVPEDEEIRRALPVIEALAAVLKIPVSIDTYRAGVAARSIQAGAQIVNDISAFRFDEAMPQVAAETGVGVVLMHSRGSRETLQLQRRMLEPIREVTEGRAACDGNERATGVRSEAPVIDPGVGFGKAAVESVTVLKSLKLFSKIGYPILIGTSRKSFILSMTPDDLEARNWGTAGTIVIAIMNGAHIVRVHD